MVSEPEKVSLAGLNSPSNRWLWIGIFLIALVSRMVFLSAAKQLPVFWDARIYASAAIGILGYLDRDDAFGKGSGTENDFGQYYQRYLQGEDIDWLYYKMPSLPESQKYLFYSGPVYPAIMAAIFWFPWPNDFQAVRWFNAVIDSLSIVIVCMLAYLLWGNRRLTLATAVVQLLYLPLILTCGILALETVTSFFVSVFLFLLYLFYRTEKRWIMAAAGVVGGILFLAKPTAALLTLPALLFCAILYMRRRRFLVRTCLWYLIPFLFLVIPWTVFASQYYGRLAIRDPEYATANFRSSSAIQSEGYDLDLSDPDFWTYSVGGQIVEHPLAYGNLLLKKLIRLWWQPHDEFWQGPRWFEITFHRLLVVAALLGLSALPFMGQRYLLLPLLVIVYYTGIHTILHAVPRYNFNALPAMFIMVPACIQVVSSRLKEWKRLFRPLLPPAAIIATLLFINSGWGTDILRFHLPLLIPTLVTIILLLGLGDIYARTICPAPARARSRLALWLPFVLLSLTSATAWTRPELLEWSTPLRDPATRLVTEIQCPPHMMVAQNETALLAIDLVSDPATEIGVIVDINGVSLRFVDGEPPMDKNYFIKGSYNAFDRIMNLDLRQMRWYRTLPISPEALNAILAANHTLTITVARGDDASGGEIKLFGNPSDERPRRVTVPSFAHTSIEKFKEYGDRRIYETYRLESISARSYILKNGNEIADDLSPLPGTQAGRFRVYLIVRSPDFSIHYF